MGKKLECTTETEQFLKTYDDLSEDSQHFIRLILKIAHLISDDEFQIYDELSYVQGARIT